MVAKPIESADGSYDPDSDVWYDRTNSDVAAIQGTWTNRMFEPSNLTDHRRRTDTIAIHKSDGIQKRYTASINDTDRDSVLMEPEFSVTGSVVSYNQNYNLSDGRDPQIRDKPVRQRH